MLVEQRIAFGCRHRPLYGFTGLDREDVPIGLADVFNNEISFNLQQWQYVPFFKRPFFSQQCWPENASTMCFCRFLKPLSAVMQQRETHMILFRLFSRAPISQSIFHFEWVLFCWNAFHWDNQRLSHFQIASSVPCATISPPKTPTSGPRSMISSAAYDVLVMLYPMTVYPSRAVFQNTYQAFGIFWM